MPPTMLAELLPEMRTAIDDALALLEIGSSGFDQLGSTGTGEETVDPNYQREVLFRRCRCDPSDARDGEV